MYELEVCASTFFSAMAADRAQASRIELCSGMAEGGLTPSCGLIESVCRRVAIPVHVLIRPREGDFCYTSDDLELMLKDIFMAKQRGVKGIVWGALKEEGDIHQEALKDALKISQDLSFTFHRAFDMTASMSDALEVLMSYGVNRVLSSGGAKTALEGAEALLQLNHQAANHIRIMAGSGIKADNIALLARKTACKSFHGSFRTFVNSKMLYRNEQASMGDDKMNEYRWQESSEDEIRLAKKNLKAIFAGS